MELLATNQGLNSVLRHMFRLIGYPEPYQSHAIPFTSSGL
jgi:hypothetical protein